MTRFLDLGATPLADSFPTDPRPTAARYPLRLTVDPATWMVELEDHVPDDALFGADYGFFTGSSPALVKYFADYATWVKQHFPHQLEIGVVEVACNDGTLLHHFADGNHLGIDPAGPPTRAAREAGLNVVTKPFTATWAASMPRNGVVIANNVTAHVPDLDDFLTGIAHLVGWSGVGVLEFQYLPDLLLGNAFDLVYHEHRRFLSLSSLLPKLQEHGLQATDVMHTPTQGGSLRVVVRDLNGAWDTSSVDVMHRREAWVRNLDTYTSFRGRVHAIRQELRALVHAEHTAGRRVALYGAPAKATTLLNYCNLTANDLEYAVDLTPTKVGRYIPGTGVPIISPHQEAQAGRADTYLLAIGNYLGAVLRRERDFIDQGGRFIVPLPKPVVV